jgi:hypothetical protein
MIVAAVAILAVLRDTGRDATPASGVTALSTTADDLPPAPWRAMAARSSVPPAWAAAWDRARNRATCALLFPADGGPEMAGAEPTAGKTPDDTGWDLFLTSASGTVEVLGLFGKTAALDRPADEPGFTKTWADGSQARYRPEVGTAAPGTYDPNTSPFEAVLTLPDQSCAYRIYDTLGKTHLEALFDRLRLMTPGGH